jgi:hypothetical protein
MTLTVPQPHADGNLLLDSNRSGAWNAVAKKVHQMELKSANRIDSYKRFYSTIS